MPRRKLTAAERKAISQRMAAYWARRKRRPRASAPADAPPNGLAPDRMRDLALVGARAERDLLIAQTRDLDAVIRILEAGKSRMAKAGLRARVPSAG